MRGEHRPLEQLAQHGHDAPAFTLEAKLRHDLPSRAALATPHIR
jgi:hypothetical protein